MYDTSITVKEEEEEEEEKKYVHRDHTVSRRISKDARGVRSADVTRPTREEPKVYDNNNNNIYYTGRLSLIVDPERFFSDNSTADSNGEYFFKQLITHD